MLVKDANDLLSGIVGGGDVLALNGVDEFGPMAFQKVKEAGRIGSLGDELLSLCKHLEIAPSSGAFGTSVKDVNDFLSENLHFGMSLGIRGAVDFSDALGEFLESVKDTLVVNGFGKDPRDDATVVDAHISDDDPGMVSLVPQSEEKGIGAVFVVVGIDFDV